MLTDIDARIMRVIAHRLGVAPERLMAGARLADDLGMDSLDQMALALAAEEEFDVMLRDEDLQHASTVADLAALVRRVLLAR